MSKNGDFLISGHFDSTIKIYNTIKFNIEKEFKLHNAYLNDFTIDDDLKYICGYHID